jgi:hypothetical protein
VWQRRYRQINDWERYLTENGIRVVKLEVKRELEAQAPEGAHADPFEHEQSAAASDGPNGHEAETQVAATGGP